MRDIDYRIAELAKPHLNSRRDNIHTKISCQFALLLLENESGDPEIVVPAILCHDLGWGKVPEDLQLKACGPKGFDCSITRIHEVEGVKLAREVLLQVAYDPQKTAEILAIIDGHDSRLTALSDSDKLVKDADKLWRFSPVGIQFDAERFELEIADHVKWLRKQIEPWFFTDTAKKLALEELAKQPCNKVHILGEISMENAKSNEVQMAEGLITEEMLDEMRTKIGLKMRIDDSVFNDVLTRLTIAKFADGVGDPNLLWHDEDYAQNTNYETIPAPPSMLWGIFAGIQFGWRGLAGFHSGSTMEFYRPMVIGDKISAECIFNGFEGPKASAFADKMVIDYYINNYHNQNGQQVGKINWYVIRTERKKAREKGTYKSIEFPHPWENEELDQIAKDILAEEPRGSEPRYWEDVNVGDELNPVTKGPIGITDMLAFIAGGGPPIPRLAAHGVQTRKYQRHPAWAFLDKNTYAQEPIFAVHYNQAAAQAMGLPYAYDVGTQRHCWQIHLLTNWMGDDGWLKKCHAEYRKFVFLSDVIRIKGKVTKKYWDENNEACVDVETSAFNQRGENIMPGWATIALPSREKGTWPVKQLLAQK